MTYKPRRSVLFMPGSNARAMAKAAGLAVDGVIMDLEDGVANAEKETARATVLEALDSNDYESREVGIRVNGIETEWFTDDITAAVEAGVSVIAVPKVESAADIKEIVDAMEEAGAGETLQLWPMIETPKGVVNVQAIAAASDRIGVLMMGTSDLAKEMRVPHTQTRLGLVTALSQCVLAARVQGLDILDGVYLDVKNTEGFAEICQHGRELGFDGKTLIHPNQIAAANEVFGPSPEAVAKAERIVDAWLQAEAQGQGVVLVDGKLVENLHVDEARRTLDIAKTIGG